MKEKEASAVLQIVSTVNTEHALVITDQERNCEGSA